MSYGGPPITCTKCGVCYVGPPGLCYRCLPLEETTGANWLPEPYALKLTAMDVGVLAGAIYRAISESTPGVPVPGGVLRLQRKLDDLGDQIYAGQPARNVP